MIYLLLLLLLLLCSLNLKKCAVLHISIGPQSQTDSNFYSPTELILHGPLVRFKYYSGGHVSQHFHTGRGDWQCTLYKSSSLLILERAGWGLGSFCWWQYFLLTLLNFILTECIYFWTANQTLFFSLYLVFPNSKSKKENYFKYSCCSFCQVCMSYCRCITRTLCPIMFLAPGNLALFGHESQKCATLNVIHRRTRRKRMWYTNLP